jgi:hypothetical protein
VDYVVYLRAMPLRRLLQAALIAALVLVGATSATVLGSDLKRGWVVPYDPSQPVKIKVEIQKSNGDWVTVTDRARAAGNVQVKHGQSDGAIQPEASWCRLTLGNDDAWLTEGNPLSPWHPVGRGTPIRVSLTDILPSDAGLFAGEIEEMEAVYPGGSSSAMEILAFGTWGVLAADDEPLRSAIARHVLSPTQDQYRVGYWPLEEGAAANRLVETSNGPPAQFSNVNLATYSGYPGSAPIPTLGTGGLISATVPPYADGAFAFRGLFVMPASLPPDNEPVVEIQTSGSIRRWSLTFLRDDVQQDAFVLRAYDANGTVVFNTFAVDNVAGGPDLLLGTRTLVAIEAAQDGADIDYTLFVRWLRDDNTSTSAETTLAARTFAGHTVGHATQITVGGGGGLNGAAVGHLAIGNNANFIFGINEAIHGYTGESPTARIQRLCDEVNISITITGATEQTMGPQGVATLPQLFTDCQQVDGGLFADSRTSIGLTYRTLSDLYLQLPQVPIKQGTLTPETKPRWDNQRVVNDVTASRRNGSSARASDEAHVVRTRRRIKGSAPDLNVETDDVLPHHARWRVHIGTAPGPRYPTAGINLRNPDGAKLADAILGLEVGDRTTAAEAAFPVQHPPGGWDQMVLGWEMTIDADEWLLHPVLVPYEPYSVVGVWSLMSHELRTAVNTSQTSIDIANTDLNQPMLKTSGLGSGYGITVNAEEMQLTAVAASTITVGSSASPAHAVNASVTPALPGGLAVGDLILVLAAIRNSGAGVPNTPAGYTRLAVFPASSNVQLFAKVAGAGEVAPTITFAGGVAGADTSAQCLQVQGKWHNVNNILIGAANCLNASAQNITIPGLSLPIADNALILRLGWKQDDWTNVTSPGTEIDEPSTTTGDDQGIVWSYSVQTTAASVASTVFTVTGGVSAISRGAILALRCDYQTATVTRSTNGVSASHAAGDDVTLTRPMRWALL